MAREIKRETFNPYLLFIVAAVLMSAGFLMGQFPLLIFAGVAPLFAIADHAEGEHFWNKLELAGVAIAVALFSAHAFSINWLVASILEAIVLTIAFGAFTFTKQKLGPRLGKLPLIFFLLAVEYLALKTGLGSSMVFLADALQFKLAWARWTSNTGYLGISLWILVANLLLYAAVLRKPFSILYMVMFVIAVAAPIAYSSYLNDEPITRQFMLNTYGPATQEIDGDYFKNGEWIPRTAAWVSALILLFAFVKTYTSKK